MTPDGDILDDGSAGLRRAEHFSPGTAQALARAARWAKIYLALVATSVVVALLSNTVAAATTPAGAQALPSAIVGYVFVAVLVGYPAYHFYRFATLPEQGEETGAIVSLGATFRYLGVLTLTMVILYAGLIALGVLGAIVASLFA